MPKVRKQTQSGKANANNDARPAEVSYWKQLGEGLIRSMHLDGHPLSRS